MQIVTEGFPPGTTRASSIAFHRTPQCKFLGLLKQRGQHRVAQDSGSGAGLLDFGLTASVTNTTHRCRLLRSTLACHAQLNVRGVRLPIINKDITMTGNEQVGFAKRRYQDSKSIPQLPRTTRKMRRELLRSTNML